MIETNDHYLKKELYDLVQKDPAIFEFVQNGSLDGIWYWDLEDLDQEWLSPRFKSFFGYADHEMEHSPLWWQENIYKEDLALALDNFEKHKADPNHPYDQIVRYYHRDGSTVWVRCRGLIIRGEDGSATRMLGAHTDITEIMRLKQDSERANKRLEEANQELTRLNEQKDKFFEIIAHDLKTPFNALLGISNLLAHESESLDAEEAHEFALLIHSAADEAYKLLQDLLEWSRLKLERMEFHPESFDLNDLCYANFRRYQAAATIKKITIQGGVPSDLLVKADQRMIDTVLRNLLSNAIKFTREGGTITIEGHAQAGFIEVFVRDTGVGIPEKKLEILFDFGVKTSTPGTAGEPGTGLGLSLCEAMIAQHGGHLRVESTVGEGSVFKFNLPLS